MYEKNTSDYYAADCSCFNRFCKGGAAADFC